MKKIEELEILTAKDLREAAQKLTVGEARYLVDLYYQIQDFRLATANQIRSLGTGEPGHVIKWSFAAMEYVENRIKKALDYYTDAEQSGLGPWAKSVYGIGPVITAGLLAHIDLRKCRTVGSIWRFAGLDPTSHWGKGEKRPFNAALKTLCWKAGESFVKFSGSPQCLYGRLYLQRKALEQQRNEAGEYKEQAHKILLAKKIGKDTEAYKAYIEGKLPAGHIHARAKRWAVKVFLAHYYEKGCRLVLKKEPPVLYSIAMLGHVHRIEPESRFTE